MPLYNAAPTSGVTAIYGGDQAKVWNAESPAAGNNGASASQQVALARNPTGASVQLSVDLQFAGAPGVFEVDVQVADVDADANYALLAGGNITAVDPVSQDAHLDIATAAPFVRLLMKTRTNAVAATGIIRHG